MKCSHDICGNTFNTNKWGYVYFNNEGWFHQNYLENWCPDHIPDWIPSWIETVKPYRQSKDVPNVEKREHLRPFLEGE